MALAADKLKDLISIITRLLPQTTTVPDDLAADEVGVELDTGKIKIGDGTTPWASLPYLSGTGGGATGATGPTGPSGGGSGSLQSASHNLTPTEILNLDTTAIEIIGAPAANQVIVPISIVAAITNGTPYTDGGDISLYAPDENGTSIFGGAVTQGLVTSAVDVTQFIEGVSGGIIPTNLYAGFALSLFNDSGTPFANGNGTVQVTVYYVIADVS